MTTKPTPSMIEAGRETARTLYLRDQADDPNWPDAISRIYRRMEAARVKADARDPGVCDYCLNSTPGRHNSDYCECVPEADAPIAGELEGRLGSEIGKRLWPILGGNHTDADTWHEISAAVEQGISAALNPEQGQ